MKIKNLFKSAIAIGSLVVLSGCASMGPTATGVSESVYTSNSQVSNQHRLSNNVKVETEEFLETSRNAYSSRATANLNNSDAKKAIESSLANAGMLARSGGEYTLRAIMVDPDLSGTITGSNRSWNREITIRYLLTGNNRTVYDRTITGVANRDKGGLHNVWSEQKTTSEIAYRDSFRQLIEDLKNL